MKFTNIQTKFAPLWLDYLAIFDQIITMWCNFMDIIDPSQFLGPKAPLGLARVSELVSE